MTVTVAAGAIAWSLFAAFESARIAGRFASLFAGSADASRRAEGYSRPALSSFAKHAVTAAAPARPERSAADSGVVAVGDVVTAGSVVVTVASAERGSVGLTVTSVERGSVVRTVESERGTVVVTVASALRGAVVVTVESVERGAVVVTFASVERGVVVMMDASVERGVVVMTDESVERGTVVRMVESADRGAVVVTVASLERGSLAGTLTSVVAAGSVTATSALASRLVRTRARARVGVADGTGDTS